MTAIQYEGMVFDTTINNISAISWAILFNVTIPSP